MAGGVGMTRTRTSGSGDWRASIEAELRDGAALRLSMVEACSEAIAAAAAAIVECYRRGGKTIFCGNGGSAGDAQHLAAEFLGRYLLERRALPALALHANGSAVTAIGNDYGFDHVFARQVEAWITPVDVLVGLSTSGRSSNVVAALKAARRVGATTVALVGGQGGPACEHADIVIRVPSASTPRVQEAHIAIGHIICGLVERALFGSVGPGLVGAMGVEMANG